MSCLLFLCVFLSCNGNREKLNAESAASSASIVESSSPKAGPSRLFSHQVCAADKQLKYSVYYPLSFNENTTFPVLMLFDPHADGDLPIQLYRTLADRYNFILLTSCDSKNGNSAESTGAIIQALLAQVNYLEKADTSLVFSGGFSGGARVAAMAGLAPAGIKGIVVCGAGIPAGTWQGIPPNVVVAIGGNRDMNLTEMAQFKLKDQGLQTRYQLVRYNGEHAWPPPDQMEQAFIAFHCITQRDKMKERDLVLLQDYYKTMVALIRNEKDIQFKAEGYSRLLRNFQGLIPVEKEEKEYVKLTAAANYKSAVQADNELFKEEINIRNTMLRSIGANDTSWWRSQMHLLLDTSSITAKPNMIAMHKRVQGALSLTLFMSLSRAIAASQQDQQLYYSALYRVVDPSNSEAWYLSAVVAANTGNLANAKYFLNEAFKNGFKDADRCRAEPAFASLLSDYSFQSIINQQHQ